MSANFTPKTWADSPATTTPLDAAGLNDLETRILNGVTTAQKGAAVDALGNQSSTVVCDLSQGTVFTVTLTGNAVVSFVNWPAGIEVEAVLYLTQDSTGGRTVTWTGVTWEPAGVAPTLQTAAGATDIIAVSSPNGGTAVYGQTGVVVGTTAGTVAAGNDSRIVGAASAANLAAETTRATAAETANATAITTEATNRANADALLVPLTQKGAANGVATLDGTSKIPAAQIPAIAINTVWPGVASQAAMLALAANPGDVAVRTDTTPAEAFMLQAAPASTLANWVQISIDASLVTSVAGRTGAVSLANSDVAGSAPLASPALTGTPTAPTAAALDNSTKVATTAYADSAVAVEKTRAQTAEGLSAPLTVSNTVATTSTALTAGVVQQFTCAAGAITTPALPALSGLTVGARYGVQLVDSDTSGNYLTVPFTAGDVSDTGAGSAVLQMQELVVLAVVTVNGTKVWKAVSNIKGRAALDGRYSKLQTGFAGLAQPQDRASSTPVFTRVGSTPIFNAVSSLGSPYAATLGSVYWWGVMRVAGLISSPLDNYYAWYSTDHSTGAGGIGLATAPTPVGPWTDRGQVYVDTQGGGSQTENVTVMWDDVNSRFIMFYKCIFSSSQYSYVAYSTDGQSWTFGQQILAEAILKAFPGDGSFLVGYFSPFRDRDLWLGYCLHGGGNYPHFALNMSYDGVNWQTDPRPLNNMGQIASAGNGITGHCALEGSQPFLYKGRPWVVFKQTNFSSGSTASVSALLVAPLSDDYRQVMGQGKPAFGTGVPVGGTGAPSWETTNVRFQRVFVDPGTGVAYLYYQCAGVTGSAFAQGQVGVAQLTA